MTADDRKRLTAALEAIEDATASLPAVPADLICHVIYKLGKAWAELRVTLRCDKMAVSAVTNRETAIRRQAAQAVGDPTSVDRVMLIPMALKADSS